MIDNVPPGFLLLPSELKHHIVDLCPRSSLLSLARTHTGYQREAEQALYRDVTIVTNKENHLKCMNTLATNSQKATFVRFLTVKCKRGYPDETDRAITYLIRGLRNMHSLSDFRLRMRCQPKFDAWIEVIGRIVCEGHFQLKTLYFDDKHDFTRIIESQTELEILGIYANGKPTKDLLDIFKQFQDAQSLLPIVFTFEDRWFSLVFERITLFPAFYPTDRCATIPRILAKSIDAHEGSAVCADIDEVSQLSIYLVDSSDLRTIHTLAKNMVVICPRINSLNISFEHECEIPSQQMKEVLSLFPNLCGVHFSLWPFEHLNGRYKRWTDQIPRDVTVPYAKELGAACPALFTVTFLDGSVVRKWPSGVNSQEDAIPWNCHQGGYNHQHYHYY